MTLFAENSFAIGIGGAILTVVMLILLLQTTRVAFLYSALTIIALTAVLLVNERRIVTPREEVEHTLHEIASSLESNDLQHTLQYVSTTAPQLQREGDSVLRRMVIHQVKIKPNLKIEVSNTDATATFNAVIIADDREQTVNNFRAARFFTVRFAQENNLWKVVECNHSDPRDGM